MSTTSTPNASPVHVQPLHNPSQAAHVVVPQAPLGNATNGSINQAPGMGAKALLDRRLATKKNPNFVSPTDNMMTPCTQKISAAKKKHFTKGAKPMPSLFSQPEAKDSESSGDEAAANSDAKMDDGENPF